MVREDPPYGEGSCKLLQSQLYLSCSFAITEGILVSFLSCSSCTEPDRTFNALCCQFSLFSPSVPPPVLSCLEPETPHLMSFSQTEWVNCGLINKNCDCLISCSGLNVRCPTSPHRLMCSNTWSPTGDAVWESQGHYRRGSLTGWSVSHGTGLEAFWPHFHSLRSECGCSVTS